MLIFIFPFISDIFLESWSKFIRYNGLCVNLVTYGPGAWEIKALAHD
jgi:hypothetical protein